MTGAEHRVFGLLVSMAAKHGEAWPRTTSIAAALCMHERNVRRALRQLEDRGLISTRSVEWGDPLPNGEPHRGKALRVFRIRPGTRVAQPGSTRVAQPAPPNDLNDLGISSDRRRSGGNSGDHGARDSSAPGAPPPPEPTPPGTTELTLGASPGGDAVRFTPSLEARGGELAAPDSQVVVTGGERMDGRHASREADNEGGGGARARSDERELSRSARRVLVRWAEVMAEIGRPLHGGPCTTTRLNFVRARLRDGFAEASLVALVEYAATSEWHLQKPTLLKAEFLFRSPEAVEAVLQDATVAARKRAAKAAARERRGVAKGGASAGVQGANTEPPISREQMVTGAASLVAALERRGGAR